ncbi:uncharacterized protein [Porites lutea]|uniref:uncharacterized protein n=1 Tax=Porites lutea TaxID=51062 RepID=UPI003CC51C10
MNEIFKKLGSLTGRFYNTHQEWSNAPAWVKQQYENEQQQHCGDITSVQGGALKGAVDAVAQLAKENPTDAVKMGADIAKSAGISPQYGFSFASGFLETANLSKK